ncbi:hypothetical protein M7I_5737 [Glarea lozoyensis 74030]|uniref:Uncharacterized protein n=1 Tax=Glarea lozoyensis (strain ATCC 74030 / MF5533) TaxID=1104152 RepID=H0ESP5_GLAL7|nr:hypothetical protein M7I_5737 [Glarea lozoyensis 74030]
MRFEFMALLGTCEIFIETEGVGDTQLGGGTVCPQNRWMVR